MENIINLNKEYMNKRILYLFLLLVCVLITGCSKDEYEEEVFSCNEKANVWAKSNLQDIRQMKVAEWYSINNVAYRKAAYVAFKVDQRKELWISKLEATLKLNWTEEEKTHIEKLMSIVKYTPRLFNEKAGVDDEVDLLLYQWKEYALEQLKWDKELIFAIITTPEKLNANKKLDMELYKSPLVKDNSEAGGDKQPLCNCNHNKSHEWFLCTLWFHKCHIGVCEVRTVGCGDLWLYGCNGMCV